jgi:hypothetical protein
MGGEGRRVPSFEPVEFAGLGPVWSAVVISGSVFGTLFLCIAAAQLTRWLKERQDNALDTTGRENRVNVTYDSTYWVRVGMHVS